jgi:hypothetical protein
MFKKKKSVIAIFGVSTILLSACMAKDVDYTEQQKRMQRCDQYIEREREKCLQGDYVTIEEYKKDYKAYKKDKQEEASKDQLKLPVIPKPVAKPTIKPEVKPEDKPEDKP